MNKIKFYLVFFVSLGTIIFAACKKDKKLSPFPELTTAAVTEILPSNAKSGGTIISNGGEVITISGICWSKTNKNPTISDDTTAVPVTSGSFVALMHDLLPSSTYYVRAYAINKMGTGYGNVQIFTTANGAPVATDVIITGIAETNETLTGNYLYSDAEGDLESGTSFKWYLANDALGTGEIAINGATEKTFKIQDDQQGKYIRFGVTPKAGTGTQQGPEIRSPFREVEITFVIDPVGITYGIIISSKTNRKWLDRNLGASQVATKIDDYTAYGDMFQWGRAADGHQQINRTGSGDNDAAGVTGIISVTVSTDVPSTEKFISNSTAPFDWRIPQEANTNLWKGVNGTNNPCPTGWRVPTKAEWLAEDLTSGTDAFNKLKLTYTGQRSNENGAIINSFQGLYWTSTLNTQSYGSAAEFFGFDVSSTFTNAANRAAGHACRCIREE